MPVAVAEGLPRCVGLLEVVELRDPVSEGVRDPEDVRVVVELPVAVADEVVACVAEDETERVRDALGVAAGEGDGVVVGVGAPVRVTVPDGVRLGVGCCVVDNELLAVTVWLGDAEKEGLEEVLAVEELVRLRV